MSKLLLCDIDGTLTETKSGSQFKQSPQDVKLINGVDEVLHQYYKAGWTILGISNQGGVEKGFKSLESAIAEMQYTLRLLLPIKWIYICPDFLGDVCVKIFHDSHTKISWRESGMREGFRKPSPGMLLLAIQDCQCLQMLDEEELIQPSDCLYVGDRPEDERAASNAGVKFCWANEFVSQPIF